MLTEFKSRLRSAVAIRNVLNMFAIAGLIALLLTGLSAGATSESLIIEFSVNFLFAFAIGMAIFLITRISGVMAKPPGLKKGFLLTGIFVIGGAIGTLFSIAIVKIAWHDMAEIDDLASLLLGNIFLAVFFGATVSSYFVLSEKFDQAVTKLAEKEVKEQRLSRLKTEAEMQALRAKINPHFLFNTLNSIASLIPMDPMKAEVMVNKLANLFRYVLDASNSETSSLADELSTIREYLDIEKVRLGDRLTYVMEVDESINDVRLPGLLLQPIVENSVKHGIANSRKGGCIVIKCTGEDEFCLIEISDSGPGFDENGSDRGFGLSAVKERLALAYGENYRLEFSSKEGFQIKLWVPGVRIEKI